MRIAEVEIPERHRTIGLVERARIVRVRQFADQGALRAAGDGRRVVGAGDGDGHVLANEAAVAIVDLDRIGQR